MDFIAFNLYEKMINLALTEGLPQSYIANLNLPFELANGPKVVPADLFFELHEKLDQTLEPGFAIRVGQQMEMDDYGVLGLSWKTCAKARELFERSERYFKLLTNTYVFKIEKKDSISKIHLHRDSYRYGVALSNEATFSATVKVLKAITERNIAPVEVGFRHVPSSNIDSHTNWFKCPIYFNQSNNYLSYKTVDLETPTAKADASINKFLLERIEEEAKGIQVNSNKLVSEIKQLIQNSLPSGIPTKNKIGKQIGLSDRTLTRRLSSSGHTFRGLIERTQQEIAKRLLIDSSQTISDIAFQSGFSEQSAFNRAFKRWTGQSPTSFRRN